MLLPLVEMAIPRVPSVIGKHELIIDSFVVRALRATMPT
ncbi:hypothetical protein J3R03_002635 [Actinoplanes couchii]|nr:hypothetical protein [Actinoplanes couchii]